MSPCLEKIGSALAAFAPILIVTLYFLGLYHSHNKHPQEGDNVFLMIYRGAEMFWHDDFAGVDWNERLKADTKIAFVLIGKEGESSTNEYDQQQVLKEFRDEIKDYPKDKIEILKHRSRLYIRYNNSVTNDFISQLSNDTLYYKSNFLSDSSIALTDSVSKYSEGNQMTILVDTLRSFFGNKDTAIKMRNGFTENDMIVSSKSNNEKMEGMYNDIFKGL